MRYSCPPLMDRTLFFSEGFVDLSVRYFGSEGKVRMLEAILERVYGFEASRRYDEKSRGLCLEGSGGCREGEDA